MTLLFQRKISARGLLPLATALFLSCASWAEQDYDVRASAEAPDHIHVSWDYVHGTSGDFIILDRQEGTNGWWTAFAELDIDETSYDDFETKGGLNYSYRISRYHWSPDSGCCRYSEGYAVTPSGAPSSLVLDYIEQDGSEWLVGLRWQDNADDDIDEGYAIERKEWGSSYWSTVGEVEAYEDSFVDRTAVAGRIYKYRVRVWGFETTNPYSNEICADIP